jgi:hypothetical protein
MLIANLSPDKAAKDTSHQNSYLELAVLDVPSIYPSPYPDKLATIAVTIYYWCGIAEGMS